MNLNFMPDRSSSPGTAQRPACMTAVPVGLSSGVCGRKSWVSEMCQPSANQGLRTPLRRILCLLWWLGLLLLVAALCWRTWHLSRPATELPVPAGSGVRQWSVTTCGPASVATILNIFGISWNRYSLELVCGVTSSGTSLQDLQIAFQHYGLRAQGFRATSPRGLQIVPRPFIAYLKQGHFVVVEKLRDDQLEIFDPTTAQISSWTVADLYQRGNGWVLAVSR